MGQVIGIATRTGALAVALVVIAIVLVAAVLLIPAVAFSLIQVSKRTDATLQEASKAIAQVVRAVVSGLWPGKR